MDININTKRDDQDNEEQEEEGVMKMVADEVINEDESDSPRFDLLDLTLTREGDLDKPLTLSWNQNSVSPREVTVDIKQIDQKREIEREYKELETMVNTCRKVSVISYCSQKSEHEQSEPINQTFDDVFELNKDFEFENDDILLQQAVYCPGSVESAMVVSESEEADTNNIKLDMSSSGKVIPFKKRERVKDWLPYCHTLSMQVIILRVKLLPSL